MNVNSSLREYRATPHSSTGRTPYELISEAPVPVFFEHLRSTQLKIQEANRSNIPKDKFGQARSFDIGDIVLVYDNLTKLNSKGIIKNFKSNNSYIVTIDDIDKHISNDNLRLLQSIKTIVNDKDNRFNNCLNDLEDDNISEPDIDLDSDDDNISEFEFPNTGNLSLTNQGRKKYITEVEKLNMGLPLNMPRTRSGRIN